MPEFKNSPQEPYKLLYWPGIPGRGEPIRLAFEESGTPYEDVCNANRDAGIKALLGAKTNPGGSNIPSFAPPLLQHGELVISQLPNITLYLGPRLGLVPDDEVGKLRVNQLFLTAADCQNEVHDTHHPVAVGKYYEEQKDAALLRAQDFRANRIPKFLTLFEDVLTTSHAKGGEWLLPEQLTYADLMLFYLVDGLKYAFPECLASLETKGKHPKVFAHFAAVAARPNIAAYLKSDRRKAFSNGIYRHYPELDGKD